MATPMLTQNDNGANNVLEGLVKKVKLFKQKSVIFQFYEQKSIIASNTVRTFPWTIFIRARISIYKMRLTVTFP